MASSSASVAVDSYQPPWLSSRTSAHGKLEVSMEHLLHKIQKVHTELDQLEQKPALSFVRVHALQDALREIESHKTGSVWLGSITSKDVPSGQAEVQEHFDRAAERLRAIVRTAAARASELKAPNEPRTDKPCSEVAYVSAALLPMYHSLKNTHDQLHKYLPLRGSLEDAELKQLYWLEFQLNHLESVHKHDGVWDGDGPTKSVPAGQTVVQEQLEACHRLVHEIHLQRETRQRLSVECRRYNREKKLWKELKLVAPCLRPVYSALSDCLSRLHHLSSRLYLNPEAVDWKQIQELCEQVNGLEETWFRHGKWCPPELSGLSSAAPAVDIPAGQALLNKLVSSFHHDAERLLRKELDPQAMPETTSSEGARPEQERDTLITYFFMDGMFV